MGKKFHLYHLTISTTSMTTCRPTVVRHLKTQDQLSKTHVTLHSRNYNGDAIPTILVALDETGHCCSLMRIGSLWLVRDDIVTSGPLDKGF